MFLKELDYYFHLKIFILPIIFLSLIQIQSNLFLGIYIDNYFVCGRFSRFTGADILESRFDVEQVSLGSAPSKSYNIAPSQDVLVVYRKNPKILVDMSWGFVPFYSDSKTPKIRPINARKESLEKNMFRYSFQNKRCIIPADGFYEWKKTSFGKIPYFIRPRDGGVFGFAGIYSTWKPKEEKDNEEYPWFFSFAIVTCDPNEFVQDIHNRMPVILTRDNERIWINDDSSENELYNVLIPYPEDMVTYTVSKYVNNPDNDSDVCIQPVDNPLKDPDQTELDDFF